MAEAGLREVELQLSQVDRRLAEIRADAEAEAVAEGERIRRETDMEISKLRGQAAKAIANILKNAQLELRRSVVTEGIKEAETLIRGDLDRRQDAELIAVSVDKFGGIRR